MLQFVRTALTSVASRLGFLPSGARVDPAAFEEDEYPVHCLNCGYALRGLPDGLCPECGKEFSRSLLLVEIYARGRRPKHDGWRRLVKVGFIASIVASAVVPATCVIGLLLLRIAPDTARGVLMNSRLFAVVQLTSFWLMFAPVCGILTATILMLSSPPSQKCRAVREAARASRKGGCNQTM